MAGSGAAADDARAGWSPAKLAIGVLAAGVISLLALILLRSVFPADWQFSIAAETQAIEVSLRPDRDTKWRIDGAILCSRKRLDLDEAHYLGPAGPCGGRVWLGYRLPHPEQVLVLNGGVQAVMETLADGTVALSLRASDLPSIGRLSVSSLSVEPILGSAANVVWEGAAGGRTFPFSGAITVGRAVTWSDARLLEGGDVVVYTGDESADRRTAVESVGLMLGDQVRLETPEPGGLWPRGFVRVPAGGGALEVVAFGRADSLRIERFGESGYDLKPGRIARLASDPLITFWGSLLLVYMTFALALHPFLKEAEKQGLQLHLHERIRRLFRSSKEIS